MQVAVPGQKEKIRIISISLLTTPQDAHQRSRLCIFQWQLV